jgi:uncharacterized protein (TIGR02271 family)
MPLSKIGDLYPNYQEDIFDGDDIKSFSVYSDNDQKVGSVNDVLVDENGRFRYLVISTGFLGLGKKVLLPVGSATIDYSQDRVYALGFTKEQAENLPEYDEEMNVDYDYEEQVRSSYRTPTASVGSGATALDRDNYSYDREPDLYQTNEQNHQRLKLHEERLVANKHRFNTGTVTVGKRVETQTAQVSVPVDKERVVIERSAPTNSGPITPDADAFHEGEVARVEVYEETADLDKQTFVREEVQVRKEVEHDTVNLQDTIRREELDIDKDSESNRRTNR